MKGRDYMTESVISVFGLSTILAGVLAWNSEKILPKNSPKNSEPLEHEFYYHSPINLHHPHHFDASKSIFNIVNNIPNVAIRIQSGDTLESLAINIYNDPHKWTNLSELLVDRDYFQLTNYSSFKRLDPLPTNSRVVVRIPDKKLLNYKSSNQDGKVSVLDF